MTLKQMTWDEFEALLAKQLPGFARREIQAALATRALTSLSARRHILAQAGCGTGKSFIAAFAALMLALQTGKPVAIATATKALQDQYAEKDLPFLATIIEGLRFVVLKGRSNYVCLQKVDEMNDTSLKQGAQAVMDREGFSGEIADLGLADSLDQSKFSTTSEECPGKAQCPFGEICYAERVKTQAKSAHIVIANHAVLAADLKVREGQEANGVPEGKTGGILPAIGGVIVDEAHELEDSVTSALGGEITAGSYARLSKEIQNFLNDTHATDKLDAATAKLFGVVGKALAKREDKRSNTLPVTEKVLDDLLVDVDAVRNVLLDLSKRVDQTQFHGNDKMIQKRIRLVKRIDNAAERLRAFVISTDEQLVRWLEVGQGRKGDAIGYAPLDIAPFLAKMLWERVPGMLMSATLSLGSDFSFIQSQLGIE